MKAEDREIGQSQSVWESYVSVEGEGAEDHGLGEVELVAKDLVGAFCEVMKGWIWLVLLGRR